jgi:acetolactate synthase-1/2/3 large subunit
MGTDAFQELDVFGMTLPIVKHSFIARVSKTCRMVRRSLPHCAQRPPRVRC